MPLTASQLATIGIRLVAVFVAVFALAELPQTVGVGFAWFSEYGMVMTALIATPFLVAAVLWAAANVLAGVMVGTTAQDTPQSTASFEDLQVVAISIVGLIIVVVTLPLLVGQLIALYAGSEVVSLVGVDRRIFNTNLLVGLLSISLKLLLGCILITTPRFWVNLLRWVREFGIPDKNPPTKPPNGS